MIPAKGACVEFKKEGLLANRICAAINEFLLTTGDPFIKCYSVAFVVEFDGCGNEQESFYQATISEASPDDFELKRGISKFLLREKNIKEQVVIVTEW